MSTGDSEYEARKRRQHLQEGWAAIADHFAPPKPPEKRLAEALCDVGVKSVTFEEGITMPEAERATLLAVVRLSVSRIDELEVKTLSFVHRVAIDVLDAPGGGPAWVAARIKEQLDETHAAGVRP